MTANSNGPALNGKPDHGTATDSKETNGSSTNGSGATPIRQYDYSTPGSEGYNIPKFVYDDPKTRPLKIITIGAGVSGIMMAYKLQKECQEVEHVIYEKNADIGGTWLENRYPGAACDVPSHAYTFAFALNPNWPRWYSYAPDIHAYLSKVVEVFDLRKYMTFHTEVVRAEWNDEKGKWKITLKQSIPGSSEPPREFEDECDVMFYATGILNNFKWPNLPGLDKFKGKIMHTARWPEDYQKEQWNGERVAVIGSGSSSIQTVPTMQPHVGHMDLFIRTGTWFIQVANNFGHNKEYSEEEKEQFRRDLKKCLDHSKEIEQNVNGLFSAFFSGSEAQQMAQKYFRARMAEIIKDERLLKGFTPTWEIGCRRVIPGDPYMEAIQKPNVDVHFTPVTEITEDGVIGGDGVERKCDTIICATGFDTSFKPRFPIIGKNGVNLYEKWKHEPKGYLGLACPDMPNWLMFIGPTWPIENGSVAGPLLQVADYAIQVVKKMQREHIKSWVPRQDITEKFNIHAQEWIKHTVWKGNCRSWYKDNDTGRVNAIWPGSSLHYYKVISTPRYEDFEITYQTDNLWEHLGMGETLLDTTPGSDMSPYFQLENVDPKWWAAISGEGNVSIKPVEEEKAVAVESKEANGAANGKAKEAWGITS